MPPKLAPDTVLPVPIWVPKAIATQIVTRYRTSGANMGAEGRLPPELPPDTVLLVPIWVRKGSCHPNCHPIPHFRCQYGCRRCRNRFSKNPTAARRRCRNRFSKNPAAARRRCRNCFKSTLPSATKHPPMEFVNFWQKRSQINGDLNIETNLYIQKPPPQTKDNTATGRGRKGNTHKCAPACKQKIEGRGNAAQKDAAEKAK